MNILNKLKHILRIYVQLIGMFIFACIPIILGLMFLWYLLFETVFGMPYDIYAKGLIWSMVIVYIWGGLTDYD